MAARKKTEAKAAPDAEVVNKMRRMRAIRKRARSSPLAGIDKRLEEIEILASGTATPDELRRKPLNTTGIAERLKTGGHDRKRGDDESNRGK